MLRFAYFLLILFCCSSLALESKPEKVYSIIKTVKPFEWYAQQSQEWKNVINEDPLNAEAWFNFYKANRMAKLLDPEEYRKRLGKDLYQLESIVKTAEQKIPGTFEAAYIKIWNMENYFTEKELLEETYQKFPDRYELYEKMIVLYELNRDLKNRKKFNEMLYSKDPVLSQGILNYNYNVLMSTEKDAIIITQGDNDTFPIWMLQDVFGIRKDIRALNISLLTMEDYRVNIFTELNIPQLKIDWNKINESKDQYALFRSIIDHLATKQDRYPLYIAASVNTGYYSTIQENIHISGLAFRYDPSEFDNTAYLVRNFESRFHLDHLRQRFYRDFSQSILNTLNLNYLPMLLELKQHYEILNDDKKIDTINKIVKNIAANSNNKDEILTAFGIK